MSRPHETTGDYEKLRQIAEAWTPEEALSWGFREVDNDLAIASGFGAEGMVVIDRASRLGPKMRVFVLDTEFLFPETYELIDLVEHHYGGRCGARKHLRQAMSKGSISRALTQLGFLHNPAAS
jgi:3'-phosphoadenosine 5'-phosphosulfate sulfotransferase (PAPS reductase)/FAD synthetase